MEGFQGAHSCIDSAGLAVNVGIPAFGDVGWGGVESVVSFIVERDCFEGIFCFFDMGAGSYAIISEES